MTLGGLRLRRRLANLGTALPWSGDGPEPFAQVPATLRARVPGNLSPVLAVWAAIEAWVGKQGGSADVPQAAIWRSLGWHPSTFWRWRAVLIAAGELVVGPPSSGPIHGPGARRRLTLTRLVGRAERRALAHRERRERRKAERRAQQDAALAATAPAREPATPAERATGPPSDTGPPVPIPAALAARWRRS